MSMLCFSIVICGSSLKLSWVKFRADIFSYGLLITFTFMSDSVKTKVGIAFANKTALKVPSQNDESFHKEEFNL